MKTDYEIKEDVLSELAWQPNIDETNIGVIVEDGVVTLSGVVDNYTKKVAAEKAVENLLGVKGVVNSIKIKQAVEPTQIKERITKAFERSADVNARNVTVSIDGHTVTLRGTVNSMAEKDEAQRAAYFAPSVYEVKNELKVKYQREYA